MVLDIESLVKLVELARLSQSIIMQSLYKFPFR